MFKIFFVILIFIHGIIHLIGFVSALHLVKMKQFTDNTIFTLSETQSKTFGFLWLLTGILFIITAALFIFNNESSWVFSIISIIISQGLIIIYWPDAKAGTIANIIVLIVTLVGFGSYHFNQSVNKQIKQIFIFNSSTQKETITKEMTNSLPYPVQHWLLNCGIIGKEKINLIRLKQKGFMRTKPGQQKWISAVADQYFTVDHPAFVWKVKMNIMPLMPVSGMDKFEDGKGNMTIKLFSLINMVEASGPKIDQAALQRYLAEISWFPSAALSPYIKWEELDASSAKATMTYKKVSGAVIFYFNKKGEIIKCTADRYKENTNEAPLEKWIVTIKEGFVFNGIKIPKKLEVSWKLKEGDFTWYKIELTEIEYDLSELYE